MDACLARFTRPPGSAHPRGGRARCSFMRGLIDCTSSLGESRSDRLRRAYCAPADMLVQTL
jgi:hypothetical protein